MPKEGEKAPDFELVSDDGTKVKLSRSRVSGLPGACMPGCPGCIPGRPPIRPPRRRVTEGSRVSSTIASERSTHMARFKGVSSAQAGLYVKVAYHFTRRSIGKLTGRETERISNRSRCTPMCLCSSRATTKLERGHGQAARARCFRSRRACFDYDVGMSRDTGRSLRRAIDRLRQHFDDGQLVEPSHYIAMENIRGRLTWRSASARLVSARAWYPRSPLCIRTHDRFRDRPRPTLLACRPSEALDAKRIRGR